MSGAMVEFGGCEAKPGEVCNPSTDRNHVMVPETWVRAAGWVTGTGSDEEYYAATGRLIRKAERERDEALFALDALAVWNYSSVGTVGDGDHARKINLGREMAKRLRYTPRGYDIRKVLAESMEAAKPAPEPARETEQ